MNLGYLLHGHDSPEFQQCVFKNTKNWLSKCLSSCLGLVYRCAQNLHLQGQRNLRMDPVYVTFSKMNTLNKAKFTNIMHSDTSVTWLHVSILEPTRWLRLLKKQSVAINFHLSSISSGRGK